MMINNLSPAIVFTGANETEHEESFEIRSEDMPDEMRILLSEHARESWESHPGFKDKTRQWLAAHQMFRRLAEHVRTQTESYLDSDLSPDEYARQLSHYGNALVGNLHGHHGWEDRSYFPELSAADSRFDAGLDILKKDHHDLDLVLDRFTELANRTIKLVQLEEPLARPEADRLHGVTQTIEKFLARHLSDEEELAVPIILRYRLRG